LLSAALLERWPRVCRFKITFTKLPANRFVSSTESLMKCIVNWIPLRFCVHSRNTQPHFNYFLYANLNFLYENLNFLYENLNFLHANLRFSLRKILQIFFMNFLMIHKISYYKVRVSTGGEDTRWLRWQFLNGLQNNAGRLGAGSISVFLETRWLRPKHGF